MAATKCAVSVSIDQVSTALSPASDNRGPSESILFSKRSLELSSQSMQSVGERRRKSGIISLSSCFHKFSFKYLRLKLYFLQFSSLLERWSILGEN